MSQSKEHIAELIEQGHHRPALSVLLDFVRENPQLHNVSYAAQVLSNQIDTDSLGFKPLRIAVLRSFTLELIKPFLTVQCAEMDLTPQFYFADYNVIQQEILDADSGLHAFRPQIVIVAARLHELCPKLIWQFPTLQPEQLELLLESAAEDVQQIVTGLAEHENYQIIVHNFQRPCMSAMGVADGQLPGGQTQAIEQINNELRRIAASCANVHVLDFDRLISRLGAEAFDDRRGWYLGRSPISAAGLAELAKEYAGFIRPLCSKTKKCLVLDLDNTLWGGIIGEDGLEGIKLGPDYPGNAFAEFQQAVLNLHHRGVILAIASKNNEADAIEVFKDHPEMILAPEHFACMKINWQDKAQSIRDIAAELNIGTDSMVFADDSDFECEMVRLELPEVMTVKLPAAPAGYRTLLEGLNCFDLLVYSREDRARGKQYRRQAQRRQLQRESHSLEDFYRSLAIKLRIGPPATGHLDRVAQMTQKTNQFNLTTTRYQLSDIKSMLDSAKTNIYGLQYEDRFGDAGLVGLAIVREEQKDWLIDTFLLSCRVIGRTVENALLAYLVRRARENNVDCLIGRYIPTAKNAQVADFYPGMGFQQTSGKDATKVFQAKLDKLSADYADYLKVEEH